MAFFDLENDKKVVERGPVSWKDRLRRTVLLTSPTGQEFEAKWKGDPRNFSKKLGIFEYPRVKGAQVQDLDSESTRYDFTIFFDGINNDRVSNQFFEACRERGLWEVVHPVHGGKTLQLVSVREAVQPVESGGITQFTTRWIEPADAPTFEAAPETNARIQNSVEELNISAAEQFTNNVSQAQEIGTKIIEKTTEYIVDALDTSTSPLYQTLDSLNTLVTSVQRGVQDVITAETIATQSLAGQLQQLTQLPALGTPRPDEKIKAFANAISALSEGLPPGEFPLSVDPRTEKNKVATLEVSMVGLVGAMAQTVRLANLTTREQAISLAEAIQDEYQNIVDGLDTAQDAWDNYPANRQYISQIETYPQATDLINLAVRHLINISPDLQIERRFTLESPRTPIQIVLDEYGTLGENDELLDVFIETNGLKGDEIILLDRGREVVVYG